MESDFDRLTKTISPLNKKQPRDIHAELERLLVRGANPNTASRGASGATILHILAITSNADAEIGRILLTHGANVNAWLEDEESRAAWTPLMLAAEHNNTELMSVLLAHGADIEAKHDHGTAIVCGAMIGSLDAVRLLLEYGADVSATDMDGRTALDHAMSEGYEDIAKILHSAGTPDLPVSDSATTDKE